MIELNQITKSFATPYGRKYIMSDVTYTFPSRMNVGLLGRNGAGKSTLLRMIGGIEYPDSGRIHVDGSVSWPVGITAGMQGSLTGRDNTRFVCRVNGVWGDELREKEGFIKEFSEIGDYFDMPVKVYSSGMRARLGFAICMAFDFDFYLIDEITAVGDPVFRRKSTEELDRRRERSTFIIASHNMNMIREQCGIVVLLGNGKLKIFDDVEEGIDAYERQ